MLTLGSWCYWVQNHLCEHAYAAPEHNSAKVAEVAGPHVCASGFRCFGYHTSKEVFGLLPYHTWVMGLGAMWWACADADGILLARSRGVDGGRFTCFSCAISGVGLSEAAS